MKSDEKKPLLTWSDRDPAASWTAIYEVPQDTVASRIRFRITLEKEGDHFTNRVVVDVFRNGGWFESCYDMSWNVLATAQAYCEGIAAVFRYKDGV